MKAVDVIGSRPGRVLPVQLSCGASTAPVGGITGGTGKPAALQLLNTTP